MIIAKDKSITKKAETQHTIHELIASRWSPRVFSEKPLEREHMDRLLEAARWAASSFNQQPWRFMYAFKGSRSYDRIYNCLSEFNQKWANNAPVLMLTAYKEQFDSGKDNFHALHDLGLAVGNMSLQAQSMGIALHNMAGVDWKKAHDVFEVPEGFHVATAIAIGFYGGDASKLPEDLESTERKARERMPQSDFAWAGGWKLH